MTVTVRIADNPSVRLDDSAVEPIPPDQISFEVDGTVRMTDELMGQFAGSTLDPVALGVAVDDSRTVEIDLTEASLRLESIDVGVEMPDRDDLSADALGAVTDGEGESTPTAPGALSFSVEGEIEAVPEEPFEAIDGGSPTPESLTFAVENVVESDGGSPDEPLAEFALFGYGVVVRRDGTVVIRGGGRSVDVELP